MTERWVKQVRQLVKKYKTPGIERVTFTPDAVVKLLARQHRAFVRMVKTIRADANAKKCRSGGELNIQLGRRYVCDDILAALAKQGARKKKG